MKAREPVLLRGVVRAYELKPSPADGRPMATITLDTGEAGAVKMWAFTWGDTIWPARLGLIGAEIVVLALPPDPTHLTRRYVFDSFVEYVGFVAV